MSEKIKRCEVCGEEKLLSEFSKSYKHRCKKCVAEETKFKRHGNTNKPGLAIPTIDWEQRRYEIAKDAMNGLLASPIMDGINPNPSVKDVATLSIRLADALIEELKGGK